MTYKNCILRATIVPNDELLVDGKPIDQVPLSSIRNVLREQVNAVHSLKKELEELEKGRRELWARERNLEAELGDARQAVPRKYIRKITIGEGGSMGAVLIGGLLAALGLVYVCVADASLQGERERFKIVEAENKSLKNSVTSLKEFINESRELNARPEY